MNFKWTKIILFLALNFFATAIFAQQKFSPKIVANYPNESNATKGDTLKILAVMVQFQPDRYDATFGDGTFGSIYTGENRTRADILDPLPHDRAYFQNHLKFVKNYFEKESRGKLNIAYYVLPNVITLDYEMRNYSPEVNSDDFTRIANLTKDAWQKAYEQNSRFDFSAYDMFIVFHAGVGRDVSLPGSLGLERDIPSVYLGFKKYREIYGDDFNGIDIGGFKITNSAVLPETESREVDNLTGKVLFELTINGLLASMVGSHLGLPDLYNTETGYSAIGRFGLMDGQSIFAYGGAFPPSLSPFEKMFLGWLEPQEVTVQTAISLKAEQIAANGDTTVIKVPISKNEYFLVQVRARDANNDGAKIHYVDQYGTTRQVVFEQDQDGFYNFDVSALQGIIVNVDEFDWALPGEGVVIWHIDENVVNANLETNSVNNDENHRGVSVVEADGITDIGKTFYDIFGDLVVGEGTADDFWFFGNNSHYYENAFTPETKPSSNSYYGGYSGIFITDFSAISSEMSFNVDFQNDFELVKTFSLPNGANADFITFAKTNSSEYLATLADSDVYIYDFNGNLKYSLDNFSDIDILHVAEDAKLSVWGAVSNKLRKFDYAQQSVQTFTFADTIKKIFDAKNLTIQDNAGIYVLTVNQGTSYLYDFNPPALPQIVFSTSFEINDIVPVLNNYLTIGDSILTFPQLDFSFYPKHKILKFVAIHKQPITGNGEPDNSQDFAVLLEENNTFEVVKIEPTYELKLYKEFQYEGNNQVTDFSALKSYNAETLISFAADGNFYLYNFSGALVENFPFKTEKNDLFFGTGKQYETENAKNFVTLSKSGNLFINDFANVPTLATPSFSLASQFGDADFSIASGLDENLYVFACDNDGMFYILKNNDNVNAIGWQGKYPNNINVNYIFEDEFPAYDENRPALVRAYNWPNPVSDGVTHFRVLTPEDADVSIKIFDLSGYKIDELSGRVYANSESDIVWRLQDIESDVYFARIEVTLDSGKKDFKIVKVAVIK